MPPSSPEERSRLLREALVTRLAEVRSRLAEPPRAVAARAEPTAPGDLDAEELLRVFMVRLWPRLREKRETEDDRALFFEHLFALREPAAGADLRFLDAWNNAYEALVARGLLDADDRARRLLEEYAGLLDMHARRLAAT